jgi:hypothetical protein
MRALIAIAAASTLAGAGCNCGGPDEGPAGRERNRAIHPMVVEPAVVTPGVRTATVEPPPLLPITVLPVVVHGPRQIDAYTQDNATVDVLWVVDNSGSLSDKRMRLAGQFDRFLSVLIAAHVDYHIGVTSTDLTPTGDDGRLRGPFIDRNTPNARDLFRAQVSFPNDRNISLEEGLGGMERAITPPNTLGPNAGFLRNEAALAVIVVSDEDDSSLGPTGFYARLLRGLKGPGRDTNVSLSAVVGELPDGCTPAGEGDVFGAKAEPGKRYLEVVAATDGISESICTADFGPFVNALATRLSGLRKFYPLSAPPKEATIVVVVNGMRVPNDPMNGWTFLPGQRAIKFNGTAIPPPGADIRISYDVAM